jgi:hypothetical protein
MIDIRLRHAIPDDVLDTMKGKIVTEREYDCQLTGLARVLRPDGSTLCIYVPGAIPEDVCASSYPVLHSLRSMQTDNRGLASGTPRVKVGAQDRTRSARVPSTIIGSFDPSAMYNFCRLTAWTGEHWDRYETLFPFFRSAADTFQRYVPDRYATQADHAAKTDPAWVVSGTPFTTITVNNSYPTGVHTDAGDLDAGFSCLAVLRRGSYSGGFLVFPRWRVAVDMYDGDLILMDAHEWHGNTHLQLNSPDAERISVVMYFRTDMTRCGSPAQEASRAQRVADRRNGFGVTASLPGLQMPPQIAYTDQQA